MSKRIIQKEERTKSKRSQTTGKGTEQHYQYILVGVNLVVN